MARRLIMKINIQSPQYSHNAPSRSSWASSGMDISGDQKADLTPQQALKKKNAIQKVLREHEALWEKLAQL